MLSRFTSYLIDAHRLTSDMATSLTTVQDDISAFCTIKRVPKRNKASPGVLESPKRTTNLHKRYSGSSDDLYVGTRVSIVPEPEDYAIQVRL